MAGYVEKEGAYNAEYDHLEKIVNRVIAEKPKDAYGLVEVLSRLVREQPTQTSTPKEVEDLEAAADYVKKVRVLDKVPSVDGAPEAATSTVPDFCEEAEMLQWAGLGFGELESYKVKCSLRNLAIKQAEAGYTKIRLWGKMLGSEADYYVAEAAKADPDAVDDENASWEPTGVGANMYSYLVTTDLYGDWTKLPNCKPEEIAAARNIKKLLTGNLSANVVTHPPFPGKEEALLRAQIARINADTGIMFKDQKKYAEDAVITDPTDPDYQPPAETPPEEFIMPTVAQLRTLQGWQHREWHILQHGRCTHEDVPDENPDEPDHPDNKTRKLRLSQRESDPARDPIRSLDGDGLEWNIKQCGDTALYRNPIPAGPENTTIWRGQPRSNAVTCVRSLTWPGSVTVAQHDKLVMFYVGYGLATKAPDFFPSMLPDLQEEPEDPGEEEEPQGVLPQENTDENQDS
jgi:radial spoke head protein 4A